MSKKLNQPSIEELTDFLENGEDNALPDIIDDNILKFIAVYDLKSGPNKVLWKKLWLLYKLSFGNIPKKTFIREMSCHFGWFKTYWTYNDPCFYLEQDAIKISNTLAQAISYKRKRRLWRPKFKQSYLDYLAFYKIKPGKHYVEAIVLYYMYDEWRFNNKRAMVAAHLFSEYTAQFLPMKRIANGHAWFGIDIKKCNYLTDEKLEFIREWGKKYNERKKTKKKPKVTKSTPGS